MEIKIPSGAGTNQLKEMVEKKHFNYYKLWSLFFYFGIFHSKSVIMLVLCLDLSKKIFIDFYSVFLKSILLLILKINVL